MTGMAKDFFTLPSPEANKAEGDYMGENGLLYCGKCNTPKQCRIQVLGMTRTVPSLCECGKRQRAIEEGEAKAVNEKLLMRNRRKDGFPDEEMQGWTFEHDDGANPELTKTAKNYVENFAEMLQRGKGLLLFGMVGTGKTYMAACIANAVIDKGYTAHCTNFARIVNAVNGNFETRQEIYDDLNSYDLLLIDDLAAERDTEYMQEIVFNVVDARCRCGKPLIVTTNLTADELKNPADTRKQRIYSRLFELCLPIEVKGEDRRRKKLKEDYQDLRGTLGL